jgi:hypothetical protein
LGVKTSIMMDVGGEGAARRADVMRALLRERAQRRAELEMPPPSEHPQDKVKRLATEFHARAHAREQAVKMMDVTTGDRFADRYDID